MNKKKICSVCGDNKRVENYKRMGVYYCGKHLHHMRRHGKILKRTMFDKNEIIMNKNNKDFYLLTYNNKGKESEKFLIDNSFLEDVKKYKWHKTAQGYCGADTKSKKILLHRFLLKLSNKKQWGDHIDGDITNNKMDNLRKVTPHQNSLNSSGKGVYQFKKGCKSGMDFKWQSYITFKGKRKHLGYFDTEEEAMDVSKKERKKTFKEFARKDY